MTQLIIDGVEVVLSENFTTVVKRENSIITKNGEYTYDCQLSLKNHTNRQLYGFIHRINKVGNVTTNRSATLIVDGKVYLRGTEVITGWTHDSVKVQIVSGASELNYFINSDVMISELTNMGSLSTNEFIVDDNPVYPDIDFALPRMIVSEDARAFNTWGDINHKPLLVSTPNNLKRLHPVPYLVALVKRIITALGYTIGTNDLDNTIFKNVLILTSANSLNYCEMLQGWTVIDFLEEVEKFCYCCFIVDNITKTCDIRLKASFYTYAQVFPLRKIVDEYEAEIVDEETEQSTANIEYELEDGQRQHLQSCAETMEDLTIVEQNGFANVLAELDGLTPAEKKVVKDTTTDRYYIRINDPQRDTEHSSAGANWCYVREVNLFPPLIRQEVNEDEPEENLKLGIVPVPMEYDQVYGYREVPVLGTADISGGVYNFDTSEGSADEVADERSAEQVLLDGKSSESVSKVKLYAALYNGYHREWNAWTPTCYTDADHASRIAGLRYLMGETGFPWSYDYPDYGWTDNYEGTLKIDSLDSAIYNGAYTIDTTRQVTFTTYDKMVADPRCVLNVHNKLWVIREIEETITANGRKPAWKVVCHPINITLTQEQITWVLDDGTWNDQGVWFDLGQWLDGANS